MIWVSRQITKAMSFAVAAVLNGLIVQFPQKKINVHSEYYVTERVMIMTAVGEKITIKYRTRKESCPCCHRRLEESSLSRIRKFDFTKKSFEDYGAHWELYEDDEMAEVVEEFVYETIDFFAVNNHEPIILEKGEMERMQEFARKCFAK